MAVMKPNNVEEALALARQHGRAAAAEATAAVRALLDAAALGSTGKRSGEVPGLGAVGEMLDDLHRWLEGGETSSAVVVALAEALESEIRRWETRSSQDEEARSVLRAFLGLRELLWSWVSAHNQETPRRRSRPRSRSPSRRLARRQPPPGSPSVLPARTGSTAFASRDDAPKPFR